jgi:hypothetical protein
VRGSAHLFTLLGIDRQGGPPSFAERARLYDPESYATRGERVALGLQTGAPYTLELRYQRRDDQSRWVEAHGEALRDPAGKISGLRGTQVIGVDFAQGYLIHRPEPIGSLVGTENRSVL